MLKVRSRLKKPKPSYYDAYVLCRFWWSKFPPPPLYIVILVFANRFYLPEIFQGINDFSTWTLWKMSLTQYIEGSSPHRQNRRIRQQAHQISRFKDLEYSMATQLFTQAVNLTWSRPCTVTVTTILPCPPGIHAPPVLRLSQHPPLIKQMDQYCKYFTFTTLVHSVLCYTRCKLQHFVKSSALSESHNLHVYLCFINSSIYRKRWIISERHMQITLSPFSPASPGFPGTPLKHNLKKNWINKWSKNLIFRS